MSLNTTPSGDRIHIGFFGRRNAGKSSVVNAFTGQELAIVSDTKGTTTDPVYKAMELLPLGPVMIIDTPGFDDEGELGEKRVMRTKQVLNKTDVAILVADAEAGLGETEKSLIELFKAKNINYIVAMNKSDLLPEIPDAKPGEASAAGSATESGSTLYVSAKTGAGINELKERAARLTVNDALDVRLIGDLVSPGDLVVLVTPIDSAAPKGRMILPQQQAIRDTLDSGATAIVTRETELADTLASLGRKPSLVVTDSQAFALVNRVTPPELRLTSFSILMARVKGYLETAVRGVGAIESLRDGDTVLISEGCTHHRQCADIGTVKIPRWLREKTGKSINIATSSGTEFPEDLTPYKLVIHCGGCMLTEREVRYRMKCAVDQGVPFTNYGVAIAYMTGILRRSLSVFPELLK